MVVPIDPHSKFGRRLCSYVCKHLCSYFPITLHVEDIHAFTPDRAYVLGYEPHSVFPIGAFSLTELAGLMPLPKMKFLASSVVRPFTPRILTGKRFTPCWKLVIVVFWCLVASSRLFRWSTVLSNQLLALQIVFLNARRGFVRVAMETGCPLVPVFCFGQSYIYDWWKPGGNLFLQLSRALKFTPLLFWGTFGTHLPYQRPMHVVVGKPIELNKNPKPTAEEVQQVHAQFVKALQDLFQTHKARLGYADLSLRIL
ncbi:hypothetical protein V6N12_022144 [Hibiscus sabdariffa]|uniref:Uncharacterized protein n=1 Tax=Hibiscus sabdariffa TaxID=183260 RepID=A0ABR2FTT6_9ROSI